MKLIILLLILIITTPCCVYAQDSTIYYNGSPVDIAVSIGRVTEIVFPMKIARVIKGGDTQGVLIEIMDNSVFILPKVDTLPDIYVTSIKGENIPLHLMLSTEHQSRLRIINIFDSSAQQTKRNPVIELMKVMMQGKIPAQATISSSSEQIKLSNKEINLKVHTIFNLPQFKGIVLVANNLTDHDVFLPLESISLPGLLAISSDVDILSGNDEKNSSTKVYIVTRI